MTRQQKDMIIVQILISIVVIVWMFFSFWLIELICIDDVFSGFRRNNYQAILERNDFWWYFGHYCIISGLIGFFGIYTHNMVTNLIGILWAVPSFGWLARTFALFHPYFFTRWAGARFFVDVAERVLVLLIALVGIVVTCRSWHRWHKKRKNAAIEGETNAKMVK